MCSVCSLALISTFTPCITSNSHRRLMYPYVRLPLEMQLEACYLLFRSTARMYGQSSKVVYHVQNLCSRSPRARSTISISTYLRCTCNGSWAVTKDAFLLVSEQHRQAANTESQSSIGLSLNWTPTLSPASILSRGFGPPLNLLDPRLPCPPGLRGGKRDDRGCPIRSSV